MNDQNPVWETLKWIGIGLLAGLLIMLAYRLLFRSEPEGDVHGNVVLPR